MNVYLDEKSTNHHFLFVSALRSLSLLLSDGLLVVIKVVPRDLRAKYKNCYKSPVNRLIYPIDDLGR